MQEKSLIKQNILKYLEFKGLSKYQFYKETGITRGVLDQNNGMSEENTARFLVIHREVSPEWLITGRGEMLRNITDDRITKAIEKASNKLLAKKNQVNDNVLVATMDRNEGIPLIPLDAMAGYAQGSAQILELDCERFIVPTFKGADYLITVKGSSMNPKYNSGDIVACKNLPLSDIFFQWNKVYVIDTIQGPLIKRVEPGLDDTHIQLISDNPKYKPFNLKISEINAIALVIGVIRLE